MTTRIDPPLPPAVDVRRAEHIDTRQAIQHHDPEFHKKKKDEQSEGGPDDAYEDLTDVSIAALRSFLLGLLDRPAIPAHDEHAHEKPTPSSNAAAAYQKRSGAMPPPKPAQAPTALDHAASSLDAEEVRALIAALDRLHDAGINALSLEKSDGFLEAIRAAIARKQALPNP